MTTSLHDYASRGKLEKIIDKVAKGRNLNRQEPSYGNTTLIVAAGCGYVDVVNWCIEQKAELNVQEKCESLIPFFLSTRTSSISSLVRVEQPYIWLP